MKEYTRHKIGVNGDWGHSRSSATLLFDGAHTTNYSPVKESYVSVLLYHFRDIASYLSKVSNFPYHTCIVGAPMGVTEL